MSAPPEVTPKGPPEAATLVDSPSASSLPAPSTTVIQAPFGAAAALVALALGGFGIGTTEFASMGLVPEISRSLQITEAQTGHVISAYAVGVVVGAPLLAGLGARFPRRHVLLALMGLVVLGHIASALAQGYPSLLAARFLSGVPHGAYFGFASLVAASLVPPHRRGSAVAGMMLGLTIANIVGVPLTTMIGQAWGWRAAYVTVAVIAMLTVAAIRILVPAVPADPDASMRRELGALKRSQVWFALAVGTVGCGGMFAVYTFISPTMTSLAGLAETTVPWVLATFGVGMTIGTVLGGRLADRSVRAGILTGMIGIAVAMAAFTVTSQSAVPAFVNVFFLGLTGSLMFPSLQMQLMNVAGNAQSLAASLNHSAFNLANAGGALLGGVVIDSGWGYTGPAKIAVLLSVAGVGIFLLSIASAKRQIRT